MEDILSYTSLNRRRINNICREVNMLEREFSSYSDAKLSSMTNKFREELRSGKTIEDILPRALAVCKEAIKRRLGVTPFDTQIIAAAAMSDNVIAEMKTGEGKTLVQILSSYLYALEATSSLDKSKWGSVHILTANEYLAQRDKEQNEKVFNLLGLSCGYAEDKSKTNMPGYRIRKVKAYNSDIVYATASTVAFDYLDDNQVKDKRKRFINREMHHAIVDEADDILLDQTTTPLILSGSIPGIEMSSNLSLYRWACNFVNGVKGVRSKPITVKICEQYDKDKHTDFIQDGKLCDCVLFKDRMMLVLSERLYKELYKGVDLSNLFSQEEAFEREVAITNAILAKFFFQKNKQYVLVDNGMAKDRFGNVKKLFEVALISETSGRVMPKTKYRNGMQEAIEAEEEYLAQGKYFVKHTYKSVERSRITYPELARLYKTGISGMTGTSDIDDFKDIYDMETFEVPTRRKNIRVDEETEIYATKDAKYKAIVKDVKAHHKKLQPILIGTTSVKESNELCNYLDAAGIKYQRLDAINHREEAKKIALAGKKGMITVATNMAGRGTDIKIDSEVEKLGGLYVIGTSKNKNSRIDRQLMGRSARQGQPGSTKYFQSLEDELVLARNGKFKLFFYQKLYAGTESKIDNKNVRRLVDSCQKKEESFNKKLIRQSNEIEQKVYSIQREKFFEQRNKVVDASPRELISILCNLIKDYSLHICDNPSELYKINHLIDVDECYSEDEMEFKNNVMLSLMTRLELSKGMVDKFVYLEYVRGRMLDVLDTYWISHLMNLDDMRKSLVGSGRIGLDSIKRFEQDANEMFISMNEYVQNEIITYATTPNLPFGSYVIKETNEMEDNNYEVHR